MKVKILNIKHLQGNKFEVTASLDGKTRKKYIISRENDIPVKAMSNMRRIVSETKGFDEVWGSSFELRRDVSRRMSKLMDAPPPARARRRV